ncbi:MAG: hypothetical protein OCD76_02010 [Reichenbachiella sp.]
MNKLIHSGLFVFILLVLASCGNRYVQNPVDAIIKEIPSDRVFSIVLNDMDVEGTFVSTYKHEYKVILENEDGVPEETGAFWREVEESYFGLHANDMGMEIASRGEDGKLIKTANPPGYNNYVGNERYGHWDNRGGSSFWAFYGQYAFMSSMFRMSAYPVHRSHYTNYRTSYYGTGRSYYGPTTSGRPAYGTRSNYTSSTRPNSTWGNKSSSFKQRVTNRTSRSGSRYGGTSSRSSGGGYGK